MITPQQPGARTPTSGVLVQALFALGVIGAGVTSALAVWLGGRKAAAPESKTDGEKRE